MSDITTTTGKPLAKTASETCTRALWRQLTDTGRGWAEAIQILADNPEAMAEIRSVHPALRRAMEPCGAEFVVQALAPLLALYGVPKKSAAEAEAFWGFYIEALGEMPREAITAGIKDFIAASDSEWFPKPGPLKAMCERHAMKIRMAENRAARALMAATDQR